MAIATNYKQLKYNWTENILWFNSQHSVDIITMYEGCGKSVLNNNQPYSGIKNAALELISMKKKVFGIMRDFIWKWILLTDQFQKSQKHLLKFETIPILRKTSIITKRNVINDNTDCQSFYSFPVCKQFNDKN